MYISPETSVNQSPWRYNVHVTCSWSDIFISMV